MGLKLTKRDIMRFLTDTEIKEQSQKFINELKNGRSQKATMNNNSPNFDYDKAKSNMKIAINSKVMEDGIKGNFNAFL